MHPWCQILLVSDYDTVAKIAHRWHYREHQMDGSCKNQLGIDRPEGKKGIRKQSPERQHELGATLDDYH